MRRVQDRERKWRARNTKVGRLKRRLEYEAAREKRRQRRAAQYSDHGATGRTPLQGTTRTVVVYGNSAKPTVTSPHQQKVPLMIEKRVLLADRVRRPPAAGWSWIDRRFLRDHAPRLSHEAILLYFFLAAVSDKHGLSFYGDATIAVRLRMQEQSVVRARDELINEDLVAYRAPLTQVLSLRPPKLARRGGGLLEIGEIFRTLPNSPSDNPSRRSS